MNFFVTQLLAINREWRVFSTHFFWTIDSVVHSRWLLLFLISSENIYFLYSHTWVRIFNLFDLMMIKMWRYKKTRTIECMHTSNSWWICMSRMVIFIRWQGDCCKGEETRTVMLLDEKLPLLETRVLCHVIIRKRYNFYNEQREIREGSDTFSSDSVHTNDTRNITTINRHPFFLIIVRSMYIFD